MDLQKLSQNVKITSKLQETEKIILSARVIKINKNQKRQDRIFLLTNLAIYNISLASALIAFKIKRKIPLQSLIGATVSRIGHQFVLHVRQENDYQGYSPNLKTKILQLIILYYRLLTKSLFPLYYYDDLTLNKYAITSNDQNQREIKKHKSPPLMVDEVTFKKNQFIQPDSKLIFRRNGASDCQDFEEFQIIKVLGRGAFGKVMLCLNKSNKQLYAIKSLRKQNLINASCLQRTKVEKTLLQKLNNPFLVHLQYAFQTKQKIFLVMPFIRGGDLFTRIKKQKGFSQKRTKFYAAQIVLGLQYLHSIGYVYRDLKPQNILIDTNGYLKISDFGLAKELKPKEKTFSLSGTPSYMSPQVILKIGHSFEVDWWALGILIYEMLTNVVPFYDEDQNKQFEIILANKILFYANMKKFSPSCKDIVFHLLQKNPQNRLGAKGALQIKAHEWFQDIKWKALANFQMQAEFVPTIQNNFDVSNFMDMFTKQPPINSIVDTKESLLNKLKNQFQEFNFTKKDQQYDQNYTLSEENEKQVELINKVKK